MKKLACVLILFACSFNSLSGFAYISGKITVAEKPIFCPAQIICTTSDISSCKYNDESSQYWSDIKTLSPPNPGYPYKFLKAYGYYHLGTNNQPGCVYKQKETSQEIYLPAKEEANLAVYYDKTTSWIEESMLRFVCLSNDSKSCPLKEQSGIGVITNKNDPLKIYSYSINNNPAFGVGTQGYNIILYEGAVSCWSTKQCKIDIAMTSPDLGHVPVGSIIVDMDNKMRIIQILPIPSSGMEIKKIEPFNTIKIQKSETPPILPLLEINNSTQSSIVIFANSSQITEITKNKQGNVFSYRVAEACSKTKECKIDLKSINGGLIGSVDVDKDNMNILSIHTTRPSEIGINQIDIHKIDVSYPNLITIK